MPLTTLFLAFALPSASAEELDLDKLIAEAQETRQVENSIQKVRMVLVSRSGNERVREFEARVKTDGEVVLKNKRGKSRTHVASSSQGIEDEEEVGAGAPGFALAEDGTVTKVTKPAVL